MSLKFQQDLSGQDESTENDAVSVSAGFPWSSLALILCYSAVFAAQLFTDLDRSIILAGEDKGAVLQRHEFWRMLTGAALHGGVIHYAMNSYAFYSFGRTFETLSSRYNVPIVFFASAIGGSVLSLILNPQGISIGASGGIVGLIGYLAVYSFKRRDFITAEFRRSLIINIGFILFYGFVLIRTIDNSAHIGGLITGAVYGFIQIPRDNYTDPRVASNNIEFVGLACLGLYAAVCVFAILVVLRIV